MIFYDELQYQRLHPALSLSRLMQTAELR